MNLEISEVLDPLLERLNTSAEQFWVNYFAFSDEEDQLDYMMNYTDDLRCNKRGAEVDDLIRTADLARMNAQDIVTLLSCSLWEADVTSNVFLDQLTRATFPHRPAFVERARAQLITKEGAERAHRLLKGLE